MNTNDFQKNGLKFSIPLDIEIHNLVPFINIAPGLEVRIKHFRGQLWTPFNQETRARIFMGHFQTKNKYSTLMLWRAQFINSIQILAFYYHMNTWKSKHVLDPWNRWKSVRKCQKEMTQFSRGLLINPIIDICARDPGL